MYLFMYRESEREIDIIYISDRNKRERQEIARIEKIKTV